MNLLELFRSKGKTVIDAKNLTNCFTLCVTNNGQVWQRAAKLLLIQLQISEKVEGVVPQQSTVSTIPCIPKSRERKSVEVSVKGARHIWMHGTALSFAN